MSSPIDRRPEVSTVQEEQYDILPFPISSFDRVVGIMNTSVSNQDRLIAKLELMLDDPQIAYQLGGSILDLKLDQLPKGGFITQEQRDRLREVQTRSLRSIYSPERLAEIDRRLAEESRDGD